jgi:hypothetical protein
MCDFILVVIVAAVAWGIGVLFGRRTRAGESPGAPPTELHPTTHDEPIEDTAKPEDAHLHGESGIDEADEYRVFRRGLGDR